MSVRGLLREVGAVQGALWGITEGSKRWAVNPDNSSMVCQHFPCTVYPYK